MTDAAGIDPRVLALDPSVLVLRLDSLLVVAELVVGDQQGEFVGFGGVLREGLSLGFAGILLYECHRKIFCNDGDIGKNYLSFFMFAYRVSRGC